MANYNTERAPLPTHLELSYRGTLALQAEFDAHNPYLEVENPETLPEPTFESLVQSGVYPNIRAARLAFEQERVAAASARREAGKADYNARVLLRSKQLS